MKDYVNDYLERAIAILRDIGDTQTTAIHETAAMVCDTYTNKHKTYVFGCTHASIIAQEATYRSGGLALFNMVTAPGLDCTVRPITLTSALEKDENYAKLIFDASGLVKGDFLILHSVSGRNPVPVGLALLASAAGVKTACITGVSYSKASSPLHSSGKRLFEVCDIVIDNRGCFGDAAVEIEGMPGKAAPTSTVAGAAIINAVCAEAAGIFAANGEEPPVFMSANVDGGASYNDRVMERVRPFITYI